MAWRQEFDPLGKVLVPDWAYWGAQTQRAMENFPISGCKPHPILIDALVLIKIAAAQANMDLAGLTAGKGPADHSGRSGSPGRTLAGPFCGGCFPGRRRHFSPYECQ